jgi:branched-chain amino acid transport system permease protein
VYYIDLAVTGLSFGCMYAMMAVGLTLVYGLLRILHIAHAAVFALGAYVTVLVANATGSIGLGFLAADRGDAAVRHGDLSPALRAAAEISARRADDRLGRTLVLMQDAFRIAFRRAGRHLPQQPYAFKFLTSPV